MSKRKILLADDSVTIQKVVDLTFQDEGFDVISVGDGNSAMDKLRDEYPDLVLADVNMPGINGYEICEKIKKSDDFSEIPVVLLVGSFEPFDQEEADRVGAETHLTKPFQSISQLVNVVYGLVGPGSGESERAMSASQSADNGTFDLPENPPGFGSLETDDDMIQTDQIGSLPVDEVSRFESQSPVAETSFETESADSFDSSDSLNEPAFTEFESAIDNDPSVFTDSENSSDDSMEDSDESFKEFSLVESTDSYGVTMGSIEEAEDAEDETKDENSSELDSDDETESFEGFNSHSFDGAETAELSVENDELLSLDEANLLEVPRVEGDSDEGNEDEGTDSDVGESIEEETESTGNYEDPGLVEQEAETGETGFTFSNEEAEVEESNELVEKIARRVVEMMSDKIIKEVAWEVVPQMADLIIKEMAREKMKD